MKDIVRSVVKEENEKIYSILDRIEAKIDTLLRSSRANTSSGVQVNLDDVVEQPDDEAFKPDDDRLDDSYSRKEAIEVEVGREDVDDILVSPDKVDNKPHGIGKKRKVEHVVCLRTEPEKLSLSLDLSKRRKLEGVPKFDHFRELDPAKLVHINDLLAKDSHKTIDLGDGFKVCAKALRGILKFGWLSTEIINASLRLIHDRMDRYPNLFQHDVCVLDTHFSKFVNDEYEKLKRLPEKDYDGHVFSKSLTKWAKGWSTCKKLYVPVCENGHWFVILIDLEVCCIYVFDSLKKHIREAALHKYTFPIQKVIPLVLKSVVQRDLDRELRVHKVENVPSQKNGHDCGIFALKFIEFLIGRYYVLSIQAPWIPMWRKKLAAELIAQHFDP